MADYPPGATVTITGANWRAGECVAIVVNDTKNATANEAFGRGAGSFEFSALRDRSGEQLGGSVNWRCSVR
jgi:hypothetical protein